MDVEEWRIGTIHDLRKTFATRASKHITMTKLQRLLGHADVTTTATYYTDVNEDIGERVAKAFSA